MPGHPDRSLALALALLLPSWAPAAAATRFVGPAFGGSAEVEVLGLDPAATEAAVAAAFAELARAEADAAALAARAAAAAGAPLALSPSELGLLARALSFCVWSEGTVTPLGGELYRLWGLRQPAPGRPGADRLTAAAERGRCSRLKLDAAGATAQMPTDSELDLFPFASGWAVDRAVAALSALGASNARVAVGSVIRGVGPGPAGRGWQVRFPPLPGGGEPPSPFYLRDRAAAILTAGDTPLAVAGERTLPYLDLRTGRPVEGRVLVAAVSDLAVDARPLAQAMFVFGPNPGQLFLGSLRPAPAVLWLLGGGQAEPVLAEAGWSTVPKR